MEAYHCESVLAKSKEKKTVLVRLKSDGSLWVIKLFRGQRERFEQAVNEVKMMKSLNYEHILTCKAAYRSKSYPLILVLEYGDGGSLEDYLTQQKGVLLEETKVLDIFFQVSKAVKYLHDHHTIHRDVKPKNIFLMKSGGVKLSGFAISKFLETDETRTMIGTPFYISPELVLGHSYSYSVDIWSLGILLYQLCTQTLPFPATNIKDLGVKIVRDGFPAILDYGFSADLQELLVSMLRKDPNTRPTIDQVLNSSVFQRSIPIVPRLEEIQVCWRPKTIPEEASEMADFDRKGESPYLIEEGKDPFDIDMKEKPVDSDPHSTNDFLPSGTGKTSASTTSHASFVRQNHLRLFLNRNLGEERTALAYDIINGKMRESGSPIYNTLVYAELLEDVMSREEMVLYIPLIKVLITQDEAQP